MDTYPIYTAAIISLLWLQSYSHELYALNNDKLTRAQNLKTLFKGIEDRHLSLLEETFNGTETQIDENYLSDIEFYNDKSIGSLPNNTKNKVHYEYDKDFNKRETLIEQWDDNKNTWVKHLREIPLYADNGMLKENSYQAWGGETAQWTTLCREKYVYDRNDNLTQTDLQWQSSNGVWDNLLRENIKYNSDGYMQERTEQQWDSDNKIWQNTALYTFNYDEDGYEIEKIAQQSKGKNYWENQKRTLYDYATDPNAKRTEVISTRQKWNNRYWTNIMRQTESHDDKARQSETISQYWNDDADVWNNQYRHLKTYSENGHISSEEQFFWNGETANWENATRTQHLYDEKNRLIEIIEQQWNSETQQGWAAISQTKVSYTNDKVLDNP
jgi:hypothetical protein